MLYFNISLWALTFHIKYLILSLKMKSETLNRKRVNSMVSDIILTEMKTQDTVY